MTNPTLIATPFAENGDKNVIPEINSGPENPQLASMQVGFPPITQQKVSEGGIPPERDDFNGILNLYGQHIVHQNKGLSYEFDQTFANKIGGYRIGSELVLNDGITKVTSVIPNNTNNPNTTMTGWVKINAASQIFDDSGRTQQFLNNIFKNVVVTPRIFGAVGDGITDDSSALGSAIAFSIINHATLDGEGLTYACHSVEFDSNVKFKNANLVCNKFDQDLVSVLECSSYNDDPRWLENVYFENIHINGKRELHTGIKDTTPQEDGGRSGFRFIRPVNGLKMINCSGNNCASDGIILFPHGSQSSINDTVKNVEILNSTFNGNRRHGGSSNSVNGMVLSITCNNNGLDIDPDAPINSGLRGDTISGVIYGNGWDCEEYDSGLASTNMYFNRCEMKGNARSGLLILCGGSDVPYARKANIHINYGSYDKGIASLDNSSIAVTPLGTATQVSTQLLSFNNVDFNGGEVLVRCIENALMIYPINLDVIRALENTSVITIGSVVATAEASTSKVLNTFTPDKNKFSFKDDIMKISTSLNNVAYDGDIGDSGYLRLGARVANSDRGNLRLQMNSGTGGTDLYYSHFGQDRHVFQDDLMRPISNGAYRLGHPSFRYSHLHVNNINFHPPATNTPTANGEAVFELTSDTQLKIKVKGSDGTVRSTTLTLS